MGEEPKAETAAERQQLVTENEGQELQPITPPRVPQYRRDLLPRNLSLSADDLREFCELLSDANDRAKRIELANLDLANFESEAEAIGRVNEFMPLDYSYSASNGDNVRGLGIPDVADRSFPADLRTFFVSNATYAGRTINISPLNAVDAFFDFQSPSLSIDLLKLPSNPTENKTVINVYGKDEDWVISTSERIQTFLKERSKFRPVIHGSGTYDYFIYLLFLPALIWFYTKSGTRLEAWLEGQSILFNVFFGVYVLLLFLLFGRFLFQYLRWLFPPMEYYKKNRIGASIHRAVAAFLGLAIVGGAAYDIGMAILSALFG